MKSEYKILAKEVLDENPNLRNLIKNEDWSTFWKEVRKISFSKDSITKYHAAYAIFFLIFGELNIGKVPSEFPIYCFYKKKDLGNLIIPEGIKVLGNDCFREATFDSIKLPTTLKEIQYEAFSGSNLSEIVLPDKLEIISSNVFTNTNLSEINLPNRLKYIGKCCFRNCNIPEITVPESVEALWPLCFYNMCSGKDIIINLPKKWSRKLQKVRDALGIDSDSKPQKSKNKWVFESIGLGYSITVNFY